MGMDASCILSHSGWVRYLDAAGSISPKSHCRAWKSGKEIRERRERKLAGSSSLRNEVKAEMPQSRNRVVDQEPQPRKRMRLWVH
jgi:hypothetical protein